MMAMSSAYLKIFTLSQLDLIKVKNQCAFWGFPYQLKPNKKFYILFADKIITTYQSSELQSSHAFDQVIYGYNVGTSNPWEEFYSTKLPF